jgi:hypothetical protein
MIGPSPKSGRIVSALLFALLISVQTISIAHAYEHDPGAFQDTACATCVSINQLAAVAVDHSHPETLPILKPVLRSNYFAAREASVVRTPRQRGPPALP